jgi:hypothetical protein
MRSHLNRKKLVVVVYAYYPSNGGKHKIGEWTGLGKKTRPYLQNNKSKKIWRQGLNIRVPA